MLMTPAAARTGHAPNGEPPHEIALIVRDETALADKMRNFAGIPVLQAAGSRRQ